MSKKQQNKQNCILYIVRHGETTANVERILGGHTDYPLTINGRKSAAELARLFKKIHIDAFFSSDLIRAKHTAEIIALEHKLAVQTTKALRERYFGHYEGKPYEVINTAHLELLKKYEKLSREERFRFKFETFIESDEELMMRMITYLREIAVGYMGKTVLVVSHGSIMRSLLIHLGFNDNKEVSLGAVQNLGFIKLESDGVDFFIRETKGILK